MSKLEYLAFEGGGGKGAAFLGAIKYLDKFRIIQYTYKGNKRILDPTIIKGISGSSAGAITAVLLASGHTPGEIEALLLETALFENIYKETTCRKVPAIFCKPAGDSLNPNKIRMVENNSDDQRPYAEAALFIVQLLGDVYSPLIKATPVSWALKNTNLLLLGTNNLSQKVIEGIAKSIQKAKTIFFDLGWLDGNQVREIVANKLKDKFDNPNITFSEMYKATNHLHLKITGTCIETSETVWFDHLGPWKDMAIADAVRISVSVPFVFKPVIVTSSSQLNYGTGTEFLFADGGILNNSPIHAFNFPEKQTPVNRCEAMLLGKESKIQKFERGTLNEGMLCFRLTKEEIPNIIGLDQYALAVSNVLMSQSEKGQYLSTDELRQTIMLSTEGLSTLEFAISPGPENNLDKTPDKKLGEFVKRAYTETLEGLKKTPFRL